MIAVVKYNAGNVRSVLSALQRLGASAELTDDPARLLSADKVIFPGVGEASSAMAYLREHALDSVLARITHPFLGICLGMQLMATHSEEHGAECLGLVDADVRLFPPSPGVKIPHVGWNTITPSSDPLYEGVEAGSYVYFVHSYYVPMVPGLTSATTVYDGITFSSGVHKGNFYGCQFHPEKSGMVGERILRNFLSLEA